MKVLFVVSWVIRKIKAKIAFIIPKVPIVDSPIVKAMTDWAREARSARIFNTY